MVDVAGGAGRGVNVHDQVVLAGGGEDRVELRLAALLVAAASEQERHLECFDAALAGISQCTGGAFGVGGERRHPQCGPEPLVGTGRLEDQLVVAEGDVGDWYAVVRQHQTALGALGVQPLDQLSDGGGDVGRRVHRWAAVEGMIGQRADVAVRVADRRLHPLSLRNRCCRLVQWRTPTGKRVVARLLLRSPARHALAQRQHHRGRPAKPQRRFSRRSGWRRTVVACT